LAKISSALIRDWQEQKYENDRRLHKRDREEVGSGRSRADSRSDEDVGHAAKSSRTNTLSAVAPGAPKPRCDGCGREGHAREVCRAKDQFGFNPTGPWVGSQSYTRIKAKLVADGTPNGIPQLQRMRGGGKKSGERDPPAPAVAKGRASSPPPPRADSRERTRPLRASPLRRHRPMATTAPPPVDPVRACHSVNTHASYT